MMTTTTPRPVLADSFEQVFEREYPAIARMAFLLLGGTGEAEEAAQDAFIVLLKRWDSIENPAGFLRTTVLNRARDLGRRRGVHDRALRTVRRPEHHDLPDEHDDLLEALRQLDLQLRELVVLRYYLGHTVPEIAALTGLPDGTVKSRLHRAVARLSDLLGGTR